MDTNVYRTWNDELRAARHRRLLEAVTAAAPVAAQAGHGLLVTGSLSRGEVHPWSDLDLNLVPPGADAPAEPGVRWKIIEATGLDDQVDLMVDGEVVGPLRPGILGSAIPPERLPPLGPLPDPDLALLRAAFAIETAADRVEAERDAEARLMEEADDDLRQLSMRTGASRQADMLSYRAGKALRRLAVFQDGGRSAWLDGDEDAAELEALLGRLAEPADEPFPRAACMTPVARETLLWLLTRESWEFPEDDAEAEELRSRIDAALPVLREWASHLRTLTDLDQTHGLPDGHPAVAPSASAVSP